MPHKYLWVYACPGWRNTSSDATVSRAFVVFRTWTPAHHSQVRIFIKGVKTDVRNKINFFFFCCVIQFKSTVCDLNLSFLKISLMGFDVLLSGTHLSILKIKWVRSSESSVNSCCLPYHYGVTSQNTVFFVVTVARTLQSYLIKFADWKTFWHDLLPVMTQN
jgi:hypothetical protein